MHQQIIDTHVHVWDFDKAQYDWLKGTTSLLNRSYAIDELNEIRGEASVSEAILVQAANNLEDTDWMLEVAANTDWISGVVGWLPLLQPTQTQKHVEEKYNRNNYFKGIRHLIHDEPDARWLLQKEVIESLQVVASCHLSYDVVGIIPAHIQTALELAEKIPQLRMVFDHLNQPPIPQKEKFGQWGELMKIAAGHKNFFVKISGLGTTCGNADQWNEEDIQPYIEFIIQQFGIDRCFCGSDWPVSLSNGSYIKTWSVYKNVLSCLLTQEQQEKVFYTNAKLFYGL